MKINLNINQNAFNKAFYPHLLDYNQRIEVYYGGAGSGKSHFICQKILIKALTSRRTVLVIRKTLVSMRDSCWRLYKDMLSEWQLSQYCKFNISNYTITLPNGSEILLRGLDDPEKIKSITGITDLHCEEATELNAEDYDQLLLRIRAQVDDMQIFLSFNPISKTCWVYNRFFEHNFDNAAIYKSTYKDNQFLKQDYIDRIESLIHTNPVYYRIYALGEFGTLDKLIYTNWEVKHFDDFAATNAFFGLDFGFTNDPSAFVAAKINEKEKEIYIFDEMYQKGMLNDSIAAWIKYRGYAKEKIIADAAEEKSIAEIKRAGIDHIKPAWKGKGSILTGIDLLQQYKIYVDPSCENTIVEFQNYTWTKDKKTGQYINEPIDSYNHIMDALRYGIQKITKPEFQTIGKASLGL